MSGRSEACALAPLSPLSCTTPCWRVLLGPGWFCCSFLLLSLHCCCQVLLITFMAFSPLPFYLFIFILGEFIEVTLVNKIIQVSGARRCDTSSVPCFVWSPPKSSLLPSPLTPPCSPPPPSPSHPPGSHHMRDALNDMEQKGRERVGAF